MKVELVKVKIKKLKEVKKQLRKKKCPAKKNLKNLLLDNEERNHENDIIYQSINAIFQVYLFCIFKNKFFFKKLCSR